MKKIMMAVMAAVALGAAAMTYETIELSRDPVQLSYDAKAIAIDIISTKSRASVTAKTVRVVSSYTNCVKVAIVTNGIGEVSTVTNSWMWLKEKKTYTNDIGCVNCTSGQAQDDISIFVFGGDYIFAEGVTNGEDTVKAKVIIER